MQFDLNRLVAVDNAAFPDKESINKDALLKTNDDKNYIFVLKDSTTLKGNLQEIRNEDTYI